ncbi:helix-turn-helix transcriptional regulator, partial [Klebsiella pneumoniae]
NNHNKGKLHILAGPKTVVWGLNSYGKVDDDEDDFWYRLYAGPQLMEFDSEELKYIRKREGYTQKEVAEAIGASVRSYQKWENGE